jgi:hypothetical protein
MEGRGRGLLWGCVSADGRQFSGDVSSDGRQMVRVAPGCVSADGRQRVRVALGVGVSLWKAVLWGCVI